MNKKVVIIGGGISGLITGIYLQKNGYITEVLEKNAISGGACIGWERKGCYIDGCLHWLVGTNPSSAFYQLWKETKVLDDDTEIFHQDDYAVFKLDSGKTITIWGDKEKLRQELTAFAPEDKKNIDKFIKLIKRFESIEGPIDRPKDLMGLGQLLKIAFTMAGAYRLVNKYSKISCAEYFKRFKNPELRECLTSFMAPSYNFMSLLYMLSRVTNKNGGIPIGGSLELSKRVQNYYLELGGKIRNNAIVESVDIKGDTATGVILQSGEIIPADWVVSTTAVEHCLKDLLGGKYPVKEIDLRLSDMDKNPIYTFTTAVFKCDADLSCMPLSTHVNIDPPIAFDTEYTHLTVRNYSYDKTLKTTEGSTVVQVSVRGNDHMYFWWKDKKVAGSYKQEKQKFGQTILDILQDKFPELNGKLSVIDVITPCTYERYLNSRHGSFQGFVRSTKSKTLPGNSVIKGLKNFVLSGQCVFQGGGMPPAGCMGRFSAQRICKKDKKKFVY
ncbi:MAG: NAD(P)/FAD-dependent oxidoreductase [Clostridia bacterium]|nr:NAD(P)/FAD-dependent oxidoreductase [Clostridia bacterium]